MRKVFALVIAIHLVGCQSPAVENGLLGAWEVSVIESANSKGRSVNQNPQPGLAIFTPTHYSLIWIPGSTAMRAFRDRWVPTDEEKIQRYGEIVVNAGTYSQTESTITARPVVSRVPEFMEGGRLLYEYRVEADTLTLTSVDEYSFDGFQAPWAASGDRVTLTLRRVSPRTPTADN
jgi:hypothetical protein